MRTWFAERGVQLPASLPPVPAGKAAATAQERLLGDGSQNGAVNFYDLVGLWSALRAPVWHADWYVRHFDMDLLDIDRSGGRPDWFDLGLLGDFLYGTGDNPHGIGLPVEEKEPEFKVEVVFVEGGRFTASQKALFRQAARRWEAIITEDVSDADFSYFPWRSSNMRSWGEFWGNNRGDISTIDDLIDDVRVYVTTTPDDDYAGQAGAFLRRGLFNTGLPLAGAVAISESALTEEREANGALLGVFTHEIAHVLGFGLTWAWQRNLGSSSNDNPTADTYFRGWRARRAFNDAGGQNYRGNKVPVQQWGDDGHWRESVFDAELMSPHTEWGRGEPISLITIQAMADLGYTVDMSQADAYTLPPAGKPVGHEPGLTCRVRRLP